MSSLQQCRQKLSLQKNCKQEGLGSDYEYTAPGMPQKNGCMERKFASFFNWVHAMLNGGKFTAYLWNGLWAEAANTAMILENNLITPNVNFKIFLGRGRRLSVFGEMCIPTYKDNTDQAKLANCGMPGFGLAMLKTIQLIHIGFSTQKRKKISWPGMWLSYKSPTVSMLTLKNLWLRILVMRGQTKKMNSKWFL